MTGCLLIVADYGKTIYFSEGFNSQDEISLNLNQLLTL